MNKEDDKNLIENIREWPIPGLLPMKRPQKQGQWPEFGVVLAHDKTTIIKQSIDILLHMSAEEVAKVERLKFDSIDAMLDAGWMVD